MKRLFRGYFPWRLYWRIFLYQILLLNVLVVLTLAVGSYVFDFHFYSTEPFQFFLMYFAFSLLAAGFFAYRFAMPFRRMLLKTIRLVSKKQIADDDRFDEEIEDEASDYFEMDKALDQVRRKLKRRRLQFLQEREESQALMSAMDDAIISVGPDLKINFFNAPFAHHFVSEGSAANIPLTQVLREPEIINLIQAVFAAKNIQELGTRNLHVRLRSNWQKERRDFLIKASPLLEERTQKIYGVLLLFQDVTELKKSERVRMEFVENASHELRTPLTSIKGYLDTAMEDVSEKRYEQLPQFLAVVSRNVNRLVELVQDMLTLSSLESGPVLKRELVYPDQLTQDVMERLSPMANEKNILIRCQTIDRPFTADIGKVDQVLQNLLGNAIKYVQAGGQVEVRWQKLSEHDGNHVVLRVIDNGPGILSQHLPRLFERFYRVDKGRSRDDGGTGLGLSIVKHVMQIHNGQVQVFSPPRSSEHFAQGCEFVCTFPLS